MLQRKKLRVLKMDGVVGPIVGGAHYRKPIIRPKIQTWKESIYSLLFSWCFLKILGSLLNYKAFPLKIQLNICFAILAIICAATSSLLPSCVFPAMKIQNSFQIFKNMLMLTFPEVWIYIKTISIMFNVHRCSGFLVKMPNSKFFRNKHFKM